MEKDWIEIELMVPGPLVDLLADELMCLGAQGVVTADQLLDTFVVPEDRGYEATERIKVYFEHPENQDELVAKVVEAVSGLRRFQNDFIPEPPMVTAIGAQDWAEGWKQHFESFRIGKRLIVEPTWEQNFHAPGDAVVKIDPGMAFGTGSHETTRLCLEEIARLFDEGTSLASVLDVGTGSGILALGAAALGAPRVLGCEIDEAACEVARENVRLNCAEGAIEITSTELEALEGTYDLVIANILAEENVRLACHLVEHTAAEGWLVLSGILKEKQQFVVDGFSGFGLGEPRFAFHNEWVCIVYQKSR